LKSPLDSVRMASEGDVILSYHDTLLRSSDVRLLANDNWINDNLIAFWFDYLEHDLFANIADGQVTFISPQTAQFIKSAADQPSLAGDVQAVLESMNLDNKKLILLPINDQGTGAMDMGGSHWSLLAYHSKKFEHFDSSSRFNDVDAKKIAMIIKKAMKVSFSIGFLNQFKYSEAQCVKQTNGHDCGLHLMANAEALVKIVTGQSIGRSVEQLANAEAVAAMRDRVAKVIAGLS